MPSHDTRWRIERYPAMDKDGNVKSFSYGCPDLNLMGYDDINDLCRDIAVNILIIEVGDKK